MEEIQNTQSASVTDQIELGTYDSSFTLAIQQRENASFEEQNDDDQQAPTSCYQ